MFSSSIIKIGCCSALLALASCQKAENVPPNIPVELEVGAGAIFPSIKDLAALKLVADGGSLTFVNYKRGSYYDDKGQQYKYLAVNKMWQETANAHFHAIDAKQLAGIDLSKKYNLLGKMKDGRIVEFPLAHGDDGHIYILGDKPSVLELSVSTLQDWQGMVQYGADLLDNRLVPLKMNQVISMNLVSHQKAVNWHINQEFPADKQVSVNSILYIVNFLARNDKAEFNQNCRFDELFQLTIFNKNGDVSQLELCKNKRGLIGRTPGGDWYNIEPKYGMIIYKHLKILLGRTDSNE